MGQQQQQVVEEQPVPSQQQQQTTTTNYLYEERNHPCFLWTLLLAPCLMPLVWDYTVTISDTELSFGYSTSCMHMTINRSDIISVETIQHINGFCEWGGYGIRKQLPNWDTGYIARNGPGVKVVFKHNNKELSYTFSCHDPETVATILTG